MAQIQKIQDEIIKMYIRNNVIGKEIVDSFLQAYITGVPEEDIKVKAKLIKYLGM